jgi:rhodanese-related sulfurtransferase
MTINTVTSLEAWKLIQEKENSVLVDVRTDAEFNFVGLTDLSAINKKTILLPWRHYPDMQIDGNFNNTLLKTLSSQFPNHDEKEIDLLFICRSGARSLEAANSVTKLGYSCYNVTDGFEGDTDSQNHRSNVNGWKSSNLPWRQS